MKKDYTKIDEAMNDFEVFLYPFQNRAYTKETAIEIYRRVKDLISLSEQSLLERVEKTLDTLEVNVYPDNGTLLKQKELMLEIWKLDFKPVLLKMLTSLKHLPQEEVKNI